MILSHKYKFIFIKTAKTAGTSIEVFLSKHCGPKDVVTPIAPPVQGHQPRNYEGFINPIPEMLQRPGKVLPLLQHTITSREKFYNHMPASEVKNQVPTGVWNGYFKFCVERNPWDKVLSHYHTDRSGTKIIVDRILRYENLLPELGEVFSQLNIPFDGTLGTAAKSEYRSDRRPYQEIFNEEQRKIVEEAFAKEIELHGYRFEP